MARSRNKYSRAHIRSRVRRPRRRGGYGWFYGAISAVAILGVVGIALSRAENSSAADVPPRPFDPATQTQPDHWHSAFAVNICGQWLSNPPEQTTVADNPNVDAGLHTHGDGFIHVEPRTTSESGDNATLGRFLDYMGWSYSGDKLDVWTGPAADPSKTSWSIGDKCPAGSPMEGRTGVLTWSVDCKARTDDPNDYKLKDNQVISLAFLPKNEAIGIPPNASGTPEAEGGTVAPVSVKGCQSPEAGSSTTTAPGATTSPPSSTP